MKTVVVTVTNRIPTEPYYRFQAWKDSITRFGVEPVVLGMGEPWHGLVSKPRILLKWLKNEAPKDIDCLIFTDSWDVLFMEHPDVIASNWWSMGRPWICGAEKKLFPPADEKAWPESDSSYRFLNSGCIISSPADMIAVLEAMNPDALPNDHERADGSHHHQNDQEDYQKLFLKQPIPMRLDTRCMFVWNLCDVDVSELVQSGSKFGCKETLRIPMIAHANGGAKEGEIFLRMLEHVKAPCDINICATTE